MTDYPDIPLALSEVPDHLIDAWSAALSHDGVVDAIMYGEWPCCHELEARAYPGQPTHHSAPPVQPCSCVYHVARTPDDGVLVVPAPRPVAGYAHADLFMFEPTPYAVWYPRCPVLSWFTIRRTCPHHGWQA